jgi:hypothetical protein
MKSRFFEIFISFLICNLLLVVQVTPLLAQSLKPGINFQALARDKNGNIASDKVIYVKTELISVDSLLGSFLSEEHFTKTDAAGVFGVTIGKGQRVGGTFFSLYEIPWKNLNYHLRVKIVIQPSPVPLNWNYQQEWVDMGSAPFEIVPYALYAQSTASSIHVKSKNRTELVQQIDSLIIPLAEPLELDDGISVSLEAYRVPMPVPNYFLFRDLLANRVIVYFTAPFSGYVSWMIID